MSVTQTVERFTRGLLVAGVGLTLGACFDCEQTIQLNDDLSGSARFVARYDGEPLPYLMVWGQKQDQGGGQPTPEEMAAVRTQMLERQAAMDAEADAARELEALVQSLPPGLQLTEGGLEEDGLTGVARLGFDFQALNQLAQIRVGSDLDSPIHRPFVGASLREEDGEIVLTADLLMNFVARAREQAGARYDQVPAEEIEALIERVLAGSRIRFAVTAPFAVVDHNATSQDGNTLEWVFALPELSAMSLEDSAGAIRARYRR